MKRTLRLQREILGSLTDADLAGVVGGAFTREGGGLTCGGLHRCIETYADCVDTMLRTCYCHTAIPNCV